MGPVGNTDDVGRLPKRYTSFIRREREIAEIIEILAQRKRLVTLVGPAGVGKTRLALRIAEEMGGEFRGDLLYVPLDSVADPRLVITTIAAQLQLSARSPNTRKTSVEIAKAIERIAEAIGRRCFLLILDNFEHLLPAAL